jgi:hypothetical protein
MILLFLLEDINDPQWQDMWSELVSNKGSSGFVLECFIERLWKIAHTKALDADQSHRVIRVVDQIEARLDWTKDRKSGVLQDIREASTLAAMKEKTAKSGRRLPKRKK